MYWSLHVFRPDGEFVHIGQCRGLVKNGRNLWILAQPDQVSETETMARGTEVLFAATSDPLPSHPTKDGRATNSCFALIGVHQCGVLMVDAGEDLVHTTIRHCLSGKSHK